MTRLITAATVIILMALNLLPPTTAAQSRIIRDSRDPNQPIRAAVFDLEQPLSNPVTRNLRVQIGDSTSNHFAPQLTFSAWEDSRLTITLPHDSAQIAPKEMLLNHRQGIWLTDQQSTRHEWYLRDDGNLEWEIILDSSPSHNTFVFPLTATNLRFFYQPPLSPTEWAGNHERPDSVVGSYAVYDATHSSTITRNPPLLTTSTPPLASNPPAPTAPVAYGTGKAFHIYRPKAFDANGAFIWCYLFIDDTSLVITVPNNWLATVKYPVRIDPTFGYTTAGASSVALNPARSYGNKNATYMHLAGAGERVDSFNIHWKTYSGNADTVDIALYSFNSGTSALQNRLDTAVWSICASGTAQWCPVYALSPPPDPPDPPGTPASLSQALTSGITYTTAIGVREGGPRVSYDVGPGNDHSFDLAADLPLIWSEDGTGSYILSMYASYTITSPPTSSVPSRRRRNEH